MSKNPKSDLAAIMQRPPVSETTLELLRDEVRKHRDLILQVQDAEVRLKNLKRQLNDLESKELPDLFNQAGVDSVGLPAEGNLPAYDATLKPYYHARISEENKGPAFNWLNDHGFGDIVKTTFKIEFGLGEDEPTSNFENFLNSHGVEYSKDMNVPWQTLTAWLKERFQKQDTTLPPLSLFGAVVGHVVKLKQRRK